MPTTTISLKESLDGQKIVMTGKFLVKGKHIVRDDLEKILKNNGAFIRGQVSGKTDLLIYDDLEIKPDRKKYRLAKKHKTPKKSYHDVFSMPL